MEDKPGKEKLIEHIKSRISELDNTAEEYFQELNDAEGGNINLHCSKELSELLTWMEANL